MTAEVLAELTFLEGVVYGFLVFILLSFTHLVAHDIGKKNAEERASTEGRRR